MSVPDRFGFGAGGTQNGVDQLCPSTSCLQAKPAMAAGVRDGSRHGPTRPMPRSARIVTERLVFRLVARDCRPSVCPIHRARRQRSEPSSLEKNRTQLVCLDVPAERRTCARAGGVVEARQDHRPEGRTRGDSRSARADSPTGQLSCEAHRSCHRHRVPSHDVDPELHALLIADRASTVARIGALAGDFGAIVDASAEVATDDEHDPEGMTIAYERAQVSAILDKARRHLADLDRALARLAAGTFGRCENCREPINSERLRAQPAATRCVACVNTGVARGL